jgi:signal peptidase I
MFKIVKIAGNSLYPKIKPGDYVMVFQPPWFFSTIRNGDLIVFKHDVYGRLIKIVTAIDKQEGKVEVAGLHGESVDSAALGLVGKKDIVGKVIWHISSQD